MEITYKILKISDSVTLSLSIKLNGMCHSSHDSLVWLKCMVFYFLLKHFIWEGPKTMLYDQSIWEKLNLIQRQLLSKNRTTGLKQNFQRKIVNIVLPINFNICFGYSKEPSH